MADIHLNLVDGKLIASDAIYPTKEQPNDIGY
jgi:hypothetical protein